MVSPTSYVRERAAIRDLYDDAAADARAAAESKNRSKHKKNSEKNKDLSFCFTLFYSFLERSATSTSKVKDPGVRVSSERAEQSSFNPMHDEDEFSFNQTGTPYDSQVFFAPGLNDADKKSNKSHGSTSGASVSWFVSSFFSFISILVLCTTSRQASKKKTEGTGTIGELGGLDAAYFKSEKAGELQHRQANAEQGQSYRGSQVSFGG